MAEYPQLLHTAIDTTDARTLAEFYRQFLGLQYRQGDEPPADGAPDDADWLFLLGPNGDRKTPASRCMSLLTPQAIRSASSLPDTSLG